MPFHKFFFDCGKFTGIPIQLIDNQFIERNIISDLTVIR
jgi:hypothetical protein